MAQRRRSRRALAALRAADLPRLCIPLLAGIALVASTGLAQAQGVDEFGAYGGDSRDADSPQDMAFEVRFGRYVPDADRGLSGTPFRDIFGDKNRYFGGIELDWQALRIPFLGTFGPGFGIGYTKTGAAAPRADGEGRSGQTTSLEIVPMYVVAVLRADYLARETVIPLVPYAKLGVGLAFWRVNDADETARADDGVVGRGISYGPQFALGGMLLLDFLEPEQARTTDATLGLNHSYVFGEWYVSRLDGFGADDKLDVGTNTWMLGLAFEL
ncbi:MAG TPA: MXAN_2562 family outer membrane beta-barrel protein [Polyangiaceae bacterium]|nr:MXAN_2562 family outer membrane beta-barrel protein [Polyangiaceae bacterium]